MGKISGSCTGGSSTKYSVWIDWSENSTTVASNISNVTATLKVQRNDGYAASAYNNNAVNNVKLYVDGICKVDKNIAIDTRNSAVVTLATWSGNITHNSDGTKQLPLSGSFTMKGASSLTGGSVSGKANLTTIPRASTVSANNTNIGSVCKITITRASSSFTHKIYYQCSGVSKTLIASNLGTSYNWTVPTSLYDLIPNDISIPVTITCETYNGGTQIGSATSTTINALVPFDYPTISSFNVYDSNPVTAALTGSESTILVKGESTAAYSVSADAKNKAKISSYKVTNGSTVKTTSPGSFANVTSGNFSAVVYDSRGFPSDPATVNKTLINYLTPLFLNLEITRPSTTSNTANLTCNGSWFNGSFGAQSNTLELKYRWIEKGGNYSDEYITLSPTLGTNSFTCNVTLGTSFSFTSSYEFEFVLTDKLHTVTKPASLLYGKPIMDIGENDILINGDFAVDGLSGMVKAVSGTLTAATAGTDYATPSQVNAKQNKITASGILKGNGSGTISAAVAGTDYLAVTATSTTSTGTYLKFADGTMICYGKEISATTNSSGLSTINFPTSFVSAPSVVASRVPKSNAIQYCNVSGQSSSMFQCYHIQSTSTQGNTSVLVNYIAIGRWKS